MTVLYILLGVLCALILLYLLLLVRPKGRKPEDDRLLCEYAHRGLHDDTVPENSLQAFAKAADAGFGIELDVQLSSDGVVMVFHDYSLARMTGKEEKLKNLTAGELQALSLAGTEQTVPAFSQVLALVNGRVPLLVKNMKKYLPRVYCGQLYTNVCRDKKKYSPLNMILSSMGFNFLARPNFIAYNDKDRNALPVKLATRLYKAPRFVWTVRTKEELALCRENGEFAIFENL